jgi:Photosynthesis system II assembly factor YCF48
MKYFLLLISFCLMHTIGMAQSIVVMDSSQRNVSFRGLSVVNDSVAWVSGSRGTIGRSTNGGQHWQWLRPKGFEQRDFRDIEGFDAQTAVAMAVDSPGIILRTSDGGQSWQTVYRSDLPGMFLDAMAFTGDTGVCLGDPIDGFFWMLQTTDGGRSWTEVPIQARPKAEPGEACFAASGTNILLVPEPGNLRGAFVTGGKVSKLHLFDLTVNQQFGGKVALTQGQTMTGGNSILWHGGGFVMAAGNYTSPQVSDSNLAVMSPQWPTPHQPVPAFSGYASCIAELADGRLIASGVPGVSITQQKAVFSPGQLPVWQHINKHPYHVVQRAKQGKLVLLAGARGYVGRLKE